MLFQIFEIYADSLLHFLKVSYIIESHDSINAVEFSFYEKRFSKSFRLWGVCL